MSPSTSAKRVAHVKPPKPYPGFPLTANGNGSWSKKINGRVFYFGPWHDWQGALNRYLEEKDDRYAGRKPRSRSQEGGLTVKDLCNRFLTSKTRKLERGELKQRSWNDYHEICQAILTHFRAERLVSDLDAEDFGQYGAKLASKGRGPVTINNLIIRSIAVFNFAEKQKLIESKIHFGEDFKRISKATLRRERERLRLVRGPKMLAASEIQAMLKATRVNLRAMILLGINCAFNNADCGTVPLKALDLNGGWINFARNKTGILRRCPLWPETIKALQEAIAERPEPKDAANAGLVFITSAGERWHRDSKMNTLTGEIARLLIKLGIKRKGVGFGALRHSFQTIGEECGDFIAVKSIMGHVPPVSDMSANYRENIKDERLRRVVDHIHGWLWPKASEEVEQ